MARIDYGQVPELENPCFENVRLIRYGTPKKQCFELKYIENQYINSVYKTCKGFSLVGKNRESGQWCLLKVWEEW